MTQQHSQPTQPTQPPQADERERSRIPRVGLLLFVLLGGGSTLASTRGTESGSEPGKAVQAQLTFAAVLPITDRREPVACSTDIMEQGDRSRAALLRGGMGIADFLIAPAGFARSPSDAADALGIDATPRPRPPLGFSRVYGGIAYRAAECTPE